MLLKLRIWGSSRPTDPFLYYFLLFLTSFPAQALGLSRSPSPTIPFLTPLYFSECKIFKIPISLSIHLYQISLPNLQNLELIYWKICGSFTQKSGVQLLKNLSFIYKKNLGFIYWKIWGSFTWKSEAHLLKNLGFSHSKIWASFTQKFGAYLLKNLGLIHSNIWGSFTQKSELHLLKNLGFIY